MTSEHTCDEWCVGQRRFAGDIVRFPLLWARPRVVDATRGITYDGGLATPDKDHPESYDCYHEHPTLAHPDGISPIDMAEGGEDPVELLRAMQQSERRLGEQLRINRMLERSYAADSSGCHSSSEGES